MSSRTKGRSEGTDLIFEFWDFLIFEFYLVRFALNVRF